MRRFGEFRTRRLVLIDEPDVPETALLSEQALGEDWNQPEEDEAWSHLQRVP